MGEVANPPIYSFPLHPPLENSKVITLFLLKTQKAADVLLYVMPTFSRHFAKFENVKAKILIYARVSH